MFRLMLILVIVICLTLDKPEFIKLAVLVWAIASLVLVVLEVVLEVILDMIYSDDDNQQ